MILVNKIKIIASIMLLVFISAAQQNSLFNTYALDPLQLNIAYSGATCTEANLHYRTQWIGMKETPKVFQVNAHTALGNSTGIGLRINSQRMGLLNNLSATAGYSYRFKIKENIKVHLGVGIGWSQATMNANRAVVIDQQDVTLSGSNRQTANGFDSEFGTMVFTKKLKAGVSVLHLYNTNPDFTGSSTYKILPQINTQASYVFFKDEKIELEPWLLNRLTINGNNVIEGLLKVNFLKSFTAGAGYRSGYGMLVLLGANLSYLKVAYSLDYGVNKNATHLGTSHQVMIGFSLCKSKKKLPEEETTSIETPTTPTVAVVEEPKPIPSTEPVVKPDTLKNIEPVTPQAVEETKPVIQVEPPKVEEPIVETSPQSQLAEPQKVEPAKEIEKPIVEEPKKEVVKESLPAILPEDVNPIATKVIFAKNSQILTQQNLSLIKEIAKIIKSKAGNITIIGYASTDGDKAHNIDLAINRAKVVKRALINYGVPADRLDVKNGGETNDVNPNFEGNRTVRFE